jgi:hypothetical protein
MPPAGALRLQDEQQKGSVAEAGLIIPRPSTRADMLATPVLWLVGLVAIALIFSQTASQYYQRRAAARAATLANGTGR